LIPPEPKKESIKESKKLAKSQTTETMLIGNFIKKLEVAI